MRASFVTTLRNGDGYVPGVEALGRSIDRTNTPHPELVLVTPDVPEAWWNMYCGAHPEQSSEWKRKIPSAEDRSFDKMVPTLIG